MHSKNPLLLLTLLVSITFYQCNTTQKENTVKKVISKEDKNFTEHYISGKIKTEGQFLENKKTGKWIFYYENGDVQSIRNYKEGALNGYQKIDYSQVLYMEGYAKNGQKIGTWKSYFKENNQLKYLKHFDDYGNSTGTWKSYYDSGELHLIENYSNNMANGKEIEYYKNGQIFTEGNKQNSIKTGTWKTYNDKGLLLNTEIYDN